MMSLAVKSKTKDSVKCEVIDGGELKSRRHLNVRGKSATLPSITDKDWEDIKFGVDKKVDFYAVSFVKDANVVHELKDYLRSCNADIHVIVKIESADSIPNLHSILTAFDGCMLLLLPISTTHFTQQKTRRRWVEIMENVLWIASAVFIIYYGDRHSNFIVILWHDDRIRRTTNNKRKNKFKVFLKELFVIYLLDQHQHYDRLLEYLDTTTPFSGFGIKKMGESKVQRVNTYGRAHLQMDDRQSKTALEEGKLEDAVSCRAKVTGEGDDKYLIAIAEQPLCAYHLDDWIHPSQLPNKVTNSRGDVLQCSHYMPIVRPEGKALPCVLIQVIRMK
ncbi:unnamed protein product [Camellia sinensis]